MHHNETCDCDEQTCECQGGGCNCDCDEEAQLHRHFQTKEEQIDALEAYLGELKLELQAVEEHLADLRN